MTRVQINISSNPHTRRQIADIEQHTGMTVTAIVTLAIDRLHRELLPAEPQPTPPTTAGRPPSRRPLKL